MAGLASLLDFGTWRRELSPTPARWRTAARITIACGAAAVAAQALHLDQGFWSIVTILVLAPPTVAASLRKAAARLTGTAAGCLAAVGAVMLFAQQPPLHLAAIFVFLALALYFAVGTIAPYSFFIAAFTFGIISFNAVLDPKAVGGMAASRFAEISLGVVISAASHLLLWPQSMAALLRRAVASKLRRSGGPLRLVERGAGDGPTAPPNMDPAPGERLAEQLDLLDQAAGLDASVHRERDAWSGVIGLAEFIRLSAAESARLALLPSAARGREDLHRDLALLADAFEARIRSIAAALDRGESPEDDGGAVDRAFRALDQAVDGRRLRGELRPWTAAEVAALAALVQSLRALAVTLDRLPLLVADAFGASPQRQRIQRPSTEWPSLLPLDPDRVHGALKGAIAASLAIVMGSALHWAAGTPATATCLVLAATSSLGSFIQKSGLRLIGTVLGGAAALASLLWVMPSVDSVTALLLLTAAVIFPCAWLVAGSDRVNYLGLQAAFAFSIGTLGPHQPSVDLWPPTSRIIGVFAGIAIFGLVTHLLWPVHATRRFRRAIGQALGIVAEILRDANAADAPAAFVPFARQRRLYDAIAACARLLGEAEYEDPGERRLHRTRALEILGTVRRVTRCAILWRQARWSAEIRIPACESLTALRDLGDHCTATIARLGAAITEGRDAAAEPPLAPLTASLDAAVDRDRRASVFHSWSAASVDALFACLEHARALAQECDGLSAQAATIAERPEILDAPTAAPAGAPGARGSAPPGPAPVA